VDWIYLAQERNRSGRLVDRAMNFRSVRNFLINLVTIIISGRVILCAVIYLVSYVVSSLVSCNADSIVFAEQQLAQVASLLARTSLPGTSVFLACLSRHAICG
jgi:hypothetical protein